MLAAAKIIFVGLCSFLNVNSTPDPNLPDASVILHRATMPHTPFIAIDRTKMKVTPSSAATPITGSNFDFIPLDGQKLTINEDTAGKPTVDTTFKTDVARLVDYAKLTSVFLNSDRVPKRGSDPKSSEVAAFLLFGNGKLTADWPTNAEYIFKNATGTVVTIGPKNFARRVTYTLSGSPASVTIHEAPLMGSTTSPTDLKFELVSGPDIEIWIGNAEALAGGSGAVTGIRLDLAGFQPPTPKAADHFAEFYKSLSMPPSQILIPFPVLTSGGGASSGYCGPDSQP